MARPPRLYRIRRAADGMYSTGGTWPDWSSKGKIWNGRGPLKNHLNQIASASSYEGCFIEECAIVSVHRHEIADMWTTLRSMKPPKPCINTAE